jgi:hypothetical protein
MSTVCFYFDIFCIDNKTFMLINLSMLPNRPYENTSVMFMDNPHHHVQNKFWATDVDNIHTFLANIKKKVYKI